MSSITAEEQHITCTDDLKNMHITCTEVEIDKCANCGKEDSDGLKACTACKMVKYCNRDCQIAHRPRHKKACRKRAVELHDEALFKQPSPPEDCPICMIPIPSLHTGSKYKACCGKFICSGCIHAPVYDNLGNIIGNGGKKCPFCRTPEHTSDQEVIERAKKRVEAGDAHGMFNLGWCYCQGLYGLPQDLMKALELWHRSGELGCAKAYGNIGTAYHFGRGVNEDEKKATHNYELAAMRGHVSARYNLGCAEARAGNWDKALKHFMIVAGGGDNDSVKNIQQLYKLGHATKEDYSKALQAYQNYLDDIKSEQRDKAAAFSDVYKYY